MPERASCAVNERKCRLSARSGHCPLAKLEHRLAPSLLEGLLSDQSSLVGTAEDYRCDTESTAGPTATKSSARSSVRLESDFEQ